MTAKTQEILDKTLEKLGDTIPPHLQKLAKENFAKIIDEKIMPKEALGISDNFIEFGYKQAYNLFQAGKFVEAAKIFDLLQLLSPADTRFLFSSAACHHYRGDFSMAAANYILSKEIDPFNPIPCFHLYDCFMKLNNPVAALYELEMTIALADQDPKYKELKERALLEKPGLIDYLITFVNESKDTPDIEDK